MPVSVQSGQAIHSVRQSTFRERPPRQSKFVYTKCQSFEYFWISPSIKIGFTAWSCMQVENRSRKVRTQNLTADIEKHYCKKQRWIRPNSAQLCDFLVQRDTGTQLLNFWYRNGAWIIRPCDACWPLGECYLLFQSIVYQFSTTRFVPVWWGGASYRRVPIFLKMCPDSLTLGFSSRNCL